MKKSRINHIYRKTGATATLLLLSAAASPSADAQYAQIVNSLPDILSPALSGSMNYKGYVDLTGTFGIGNNQVNFIGISTTQGFRYSSWFFMGAGVGIDAAISSGVVDGPQDGFYYSNTSKTRAMIPLFSDFRFNIGNNGTGPSFFIDLKAGAAWIIGGDGLQLKDGILTTSTKFLFKPSIGVRIPTNRQNPRQAFNVGVTYQLLTANNSWGYYGNYRYDTTVSAIGASVSYEW